MHFSKIYIQKNFVPDVVADQFGRESIGIEVTLNEGESLDDARLQAQQFIKEHIEKNTVYHSPDIAEVRNNNFEWAGFKPPTILPSIQKEEEPRPALLDEWVKEIEGCEDVSQLKT